jgi:hypothetical protein
MTEEKTGSILVALRLDQRLLDWATLKCEAFI